MPGKHSKAFLAQLKFPSFTRFSSNRQECTSLSHTLAYCSTEKPYPPPPFENSQLSRETEKEEWKKGKRRRWIFLSCGFLGCRSHALRRMSWTERRMEDERRGKKWLDHRWSVGCHRHWKRKGGGGGGGGPYLALTGGGRRRFVTHPPPPSSFMRRSSLCYSQGHSIPSSGQRGRGGYHHHHHVRHIGELKRGREIKRDMAYLKKEETPVRRSPTHGKEESAISHPWP